MHITAMKKLLLVLALALCTTINADEYTREGNNFTKVSTVQTSADTQTNYTYTIKGNTYPIYITKNGRCYVVRVSKNGNEYRQYLEESIARQICAELHIEYKELAKQ